MRFLVENRLRMVLLRTRGQNRDRNRAHDRHQCRRHSGCALPTISCAPGRQGQADPGCMQPAPVIIWTVFSKRQRNLTVVREVGLELEGLVIVGEDVPGFVYIELGKDPAVVGASIAGLELGGLIIVDDGLLVLT